MDPSCRVGGVVSVLFGNAAPIVSVRSASLLEQREFEPAVSSDKKTGLSSHWKRFVCKRKLRRRTSAGELFTGPNDFLAPPFITTSSLNGPGCVPKWARHTHCSFPASSRPVFAPKGYSQNLSASHAHRSRELGGALAGNPARKGIDCRAKANRPNCGERWCPFIAQTPFRPRQRIAKRRRRRILPSCHFMSEE
jgi:hypothetical protein